MGTSRVVVFGGSGWVGTVLVPLLEEGAAEVLAPPRAELDLEDAGAITRYVERAGPTAVVNVAAANPGASEVLFDPINVRAAEAMAAGARAVGARLVHVSSDAGLDGRSAPYADDAAMNPLTPYGRSKAEGEARVLAACPAAVVVRTSLLWDPDVMDRGTAGFAGRLEAGESCRLFTDEIRCPLPRRVLAACLADLLRVSWVGPLNVAGREAVSRLDFGILLLDHFGVAGLHRIEGIRSADLTAAGAPPRPLDLTLDVTRAERLLGRRLPGVRDVLAS